MTTLCSSEWQCPWEGSVSARATASTEHPWAQWQLPGPSQALALLWLHWQKLTAACLVLAAGRASLCPSLWLLRSSLEGGKTKSRILLKIHTTNTFLKTERLSQTDWAAKPFPLYGPAVLWNKGKPEYHTLNSRKAVEMCKYLRKCVSSYGREVVNPFAALKKKLRK